LIIGVFLSLILIILFSVLDTHTGVICNGIYSINPGQQRVCQPSAFWDDAFFAGEGVTAYAFGQSAFRSMATKLSNKTFDVTETVPARGFKYWNLTGTHTMTLYYHYKASDKVNIGVLDDSDFRTFMKSGTMNGKFVDKEVLESSRTLSGSTASVVFHVVVHNPQSSPVKVKETGCMLATHIPSYPPWQGKHAQERKDAGLTTISGINLLSSWSTLAPTGASLISKY